MVMNKVSICIVYSQRGVADACDTEKSHSTLSSELEETLGDRLACMTMMLWLILSTMILMMLTLTWMTKRICATNTEHEVLNPFMAAELLLTTAAEDVVVPTKRCEYQRDFEQTMEESILQEHDISNKEKKALARKAKRRVAWRNAASTSGQVGCNAQKQFSSTCEARGGLATRRA
mmetsp:Transcript_100304/g.288142  ORF Transcript_100304/g.288142 Transcript_100304/m.288142 type:complete len:176 (-) Transcript_100304:1596-2123(-)